MRVVLKSATILSGCLLAAVAWSEAIRPSGFRIGSASYHAVVADLSSGAVTARVTMSDRLTSPWRLVAHDYPAAAITGTFFSWSSQRPVGDVVVDGRIRAHGWRASALAIDWTGKAKIFDAGFRERVDWTPYRHGLRAAVRIVRDGRVTPDPRSQGFTDPAIWGRAARTAVGLRKDGDMVLLATRNSVTLSELGRAAVYAGCVDAISLDGGGSTMLYYMGRMLVPTSRALSNVLVLHERSPLDDQARQVLGPTEFAMLERERDAKAMFGGDW